MSEEPGSAGARVGGVTGGFSSAFTPYEALGGDAPVRALVETFYDLMDREPAFAALRALHTADLATSRQKLHEFLSGWLGGPPLYEQRYGHPRLRARHMHVRIDEAARDQWLECMGRAMDARGITGELRAFLDGRFRHVADFMRNQPS